MLNAWLIISLTSFKKAIRCIDDQSSRLYIKITIKRLRQEKNINLNNEVFIFRIVAG